MRINIYLAINQISKHKAKIYDHRTYTKISSLKYKIFFVLLSIRMINLSIDELKLIAQIRNISDYENKSKEDLIKALNETKLQNIKT